MTKKKRIKIAHAKGRPVLTWIGKKPIRQITPFPAQRIESFGPFIETPHWDPELWRDWPEEFPQEGLLYHGDNKEVLAHLISNGFRGKVKLVYIDPPFGSGANYVRKIQLRGIKGRAKIEGKGYSLGEQIQYTDIWEHDNYLQFMYERLLLLRELLSNDGSIYLHCDTSKNHLLRCLLDEVFGPDCFRNEIIREKCNPKNYTKNAFGNVHDTIYLYSKSTDKQVWSRPYSPWGQDELSNAFPKIEEKTGRHYKTAPLHAPETRKGETGKKWRGLAPPPGTHWRYVHAELDRLDEASRIEWSSTGNPREKIYSDESKGKFVQDIWLGMKDTPKLGYPTEKNEALCEWIVNASTEPGDIVLDCFVGSGTTAAVSQRLGRRWIGCDINRGAIQVTCKRLQLIMEEQAKQSLLVSTDGVFSPAQLSFSVFNVNNYNLRTQHDEMVRLVCEHIGIVRSKDSFFDGVLGKRLCKVATLTQPLSPLDLDSLKTELEARPDEDRNIVIVCLGKEISTEQWLDDWNRLRTNGNVPNQIEVIELRTDPKYGRFLVHKPSSARISMKREGKKIRIDIQEFVSPSIIERLTMQAGFLEPDIDHWAAMVDSVMIDPSYNGKVFDVVYSDIPTNHDDYVKGSYLIDAPEEKVLVAVKITDMLGEEVVITCEV